MIAVIHAALLGVHGLGAVLSLQQIKLDKTVVVVVAIDLLKAASSSLCDQLQARTLSSGGAGHIYMAFGGVCSSVVKTYVRIVRILGKRKREKLLLAGG